MTASPTDFPVSRYDEHGLAFPLAVLSPDEVARFRASVEELQDSLGGKPPAVEQGQTHLSFAWAYELSTHPAVLDAAEKILGPNLIVWSTSIFVKYARDPGYVSWHQDGTYWGLDSGKVATAWIALSESTVENGCMRVAPGTHTEPIHPHKDTYAENNQLTRGQEVAVDVNEDDAVDIVLKPGEMSLHHVNLIHGSNANGTDGKRIGYVIRYITTDVKQSGTDQAVILARGVDEYGHSKRLETPPTANVQEGLAAHKKVTQEMVTALRKTKGAY